MLKQAITILFCGTLSTFGYTQNITGPELMEKTINFHDPQGKWAELNVQLNLEETRPDGTIRQSLVILRNNESYFQMSQNLDGLQIVRTTFSDSCVVTIDGSANISSEMIEKYSLTDDRVLRTRNYYFYLYGLPMKLTDPGTNIENEVELVEFNDKEYLELKVTYDAEVGSDDWFFYIDPDSYALEGYKFYHANGKGEYITLEGTVTIGGINIPKLRKWYLIEGDEYLGADNLVSGKLLP